MRQKFTPEQKELICKLYKQGISPIEICRQTPEFQSRKPQTLYPILIKEGLYQKKSLTDLRRNTVDDTFFDEINTEHKAYWLGFLLADGYIVDSGHAKNSFGITLKSVDKSILEEFKKDLKTTYEVKDYQGHSNFNGNNFTVEYSRLLVRSKSICQKLKEYGFTTKKSYDAKFPLSYVPENLLHHFIRGYFDGDGGFSKPGEKKWHTYTMTFTGTIEIINDIRKILGKENLKISKRYPERNNNNASLAICGDFQIYKIGLWLYRDATIFLDRKYKRFLEIKNKYESNK